MERLLEGRYQPDELLGSGGMGTVWRGRDLRLGRPVAIKELTGPGAGDSTLVQRFDREARTVAQLTHPNIVSVFDVGTEDGHPYLVMELVEGRTVASILTGGPLPLGQAVAIAAQVCDGLAAAHAAGVVHRDIKPANLILTPAGVVKICDFGLARMQQAEQADLTGSAVAVGSAKYMAPEQINSQPVDGRTDLYGLGCTLYALLTGGPPFTGDNPIGIVHQHLTEPPAPVQSRRPDVPPSLAELVSDLLAKDPAGRPADATEVRARLAATGLAPAERLAAVPGAAAVVAEMPTAAYAGASTAPGSPAAGTAAAAPDSTAAEPTVVVPPPQGPRPAAGSGRGWLATGAGLLVLTAVVAALVALPGLLGDREPGTVPATSSPAPTELVTPTRAGPTTPTATATRETVAPQASSAAPPPTSAAPPPTSAAPAQPVDAIISLRQAIDQQAAAGALERKAADDLTHKVDDLERANAEDDRAEAVKKTQEIRNKLDDLLSEEKISQSTYDALRAAVDRVAVALG